MNQSPHTRLVLRSDFLKHNIGYLRQRIPQKTRLMAILKNNAYGHGLKQFAAMCYEEGIRHFALYHPFAVKKLLRHLPGDCEYLVLGYPSESELPELLRHQVHLTVNSIQAYQAIEQNAQEIGQTARIQLEFETGMERTGLTRDELSRLLAAGRESPHILITAVYSHLSGDPVPGNLERVNRQIERFRSIAEDFFREDELYFHLSNSFGIALETGEVLEFVRPGISLFGYWSSPEVHQQLIQSNPDSPGILKPVMRWETTLTDIREVPAGRFIGYGQTFKTDHQTTVGIIPVGYGDGYPKQLENNAHVWIKGRAAPLVGAINMNLMQIDLTDRNDVSVGDTVLLMSDGSGPEELRADNLAEQSNRYLYEFLANISPYIHREVE